MSTMLTILGVAMVAGLGLRRYGFFEFGFKFATTKPTTTRDSHSQTDERHSGVARHHGGRLAQDRIDPWLWCCSADYIEAGLGYGHTCEPTVQGRWLLMR